MSGDTITVITSPVTVSVVGDAPVAVDVAGSTEVIDVGYTIPGSALVGPAGPAGPAGPEGPSGPGGPAGPVDSVNGQTGAVDLTAASFGLAVPVVVPVMMPSAIWTITHGFPYNPNVLTYDSDGNVIDGDVAYPDGTTVTVTWAGAEIGSVELT